MKKVLLMSDLDRSPLNENLAVQANDSDGVNAAGVTSQISAGGLLRQAREAAGLNIAALALSLKVPVKKLEALEADRIDLLPDVVFVRALASSVCRTLKIDAASVLDRLPQTCNPTLTYQGMDINTPFRSPNNAPGPSLWAHISRPAVLAGLVLLLGALVLIFLPAVKSGVNDNRANAVAGSANAESVKVLAPVVALEAGSANATSLPVSIDDPLTSPATLSSAVLSVQAPAVLTTPMAAVFASPASLTAVSLSPAVAAPAVPASAALQLPSTGIVVFSAKGPSWVEVTDSTGQVVMRRTLSAGEVAGVSGALPLAAVVGRADATQVQIRGKAFDLSAFAKDNVARFEVK